MRDRDWRSSKARQLFQLLLTERGRTLPRDRVLEALWPEMDPDAAANNLRVTLIGWQSRQPDRPEGAPPAYLIQQGDTYGFNTESDHQLDAVDFAEAVASGQRAARAASASPRSPLSAQQSGCTAGRTCPTICTRIGRLSSASGWQCYSTMPRCGSARYCLKKG